MTEYHKLARKLKLIPQSAENACGHDFEIRSSECGPGSAVQHNVQIQVLTTNDAVHTTLKLLREAVMISVRFRKTEVHV